ncbi:MAG: hypothetical protein KGV57_03005 [Fusobacterium sp.]|nr:hypothetical protein [Fusobacterium sp.]
MHKKISILFILFSFFFFSSKELNALSLKGIKNAYYRDNTIIIKTMKNMRIGIDILGDKSFITPEILILDYYNNSINPKDIKWKIVQEDDDGVIVCASAEYSDFYFPIKQNGNKISIVVEEILAKHAVGSDQNWFQLYEEVYSAPALKKAQAEALQQYNF